MIAPEAIDRLMRSTILLESLIWVSNARALQPTNWRPRAARIGCRNGFFNPAGARNQIGAATPIEEMVASNSSISRISPLGPKRQKLNRGWGWGWFPMV